MSIFLNYVKINLVVNDKITENECELAQLFNAQKQSPGGVPLKEVFLEISQNSQESLIKLQAESYRDPDTGFTCEFCEFYEISTNTFSYRATPVAVSECSSLNQKW